MADENNGANNSQGEDLPQGGQPLANEKAPSDNKPVDKAEQARREQQSKKDKANSQLDETNERLASLEEAEAVRARDAYVSEVVSDKEKFPNVEANDPMFQYAYSKEDVEKIAKQLQDKYSTLQQKALSDVQSEPEYLTDEQVEEEEKKLEEEAGKTGSSKFGNFLNLQARRKR